MKERRSVIELDLKFDCAPTIKIKEIIKVPQHSSSQKYTYAKLHQVLKVLPHPSCKWYFFLS